MNFSFGICKSINSLFLKDIIYSIRQQNIDNYEIIIVGENHTEFGDDIINIDFDESIKPGWITKKKNLITKNAKYENIVYLHDYICFHPDWYEGQKLKGCDITIRMDRIKNKNGNRFRDWCIWPHNDKDIDVIIGRSIMIPYNITHLSKYMYINGAYWIANKKIMTEFQLNEDLVWGQSEDVEWSKRVREKYNFEMNEFSEVRFLKQQSNHDFTECSNNVINILKEYEKNKSF